ncbi:mCG147342 [Mus musculus]|nr:mCG147342 [Mus musculus]
MLAVSPKALLTFLYPVSYSHSSITITEISFFCFLNHLFNHNISS